LIRIPDYWTTRRFLTWFFPEYARLPVITVTPDSGWHFNNLISRGEVELKIRSSCHVELSSEESISRALENFDLGREIYTGSHLEKVPIDEYFPDSIRSEISQWGHLIR
jgi:hypothetical protein